MFVCISSDALQIHIVLMAVSDCRSMTGLRCIYIIRIYACTYDTYIETAGIRQGWCGLLLGRR